MTKLQRWKNHATRRQELTGLLSEPAAQDAIEIVKDRLFDLTLPPTGGQYSLIEFYALFGARQMGYLECLQNLLNLTAIQPLKVPDRKPWTTVLDRAAEGQPKPTPQP